MRGNSDYLMTSQARRQMTNRHICSPSLVLKKYFKKPVQPALLQDQVLFKTRHLNTMIRYTHIFFAIVFKLFCISEVTYKTHKIYPHHITMSTSKCMRPKIHDLNGLSLLPSLKTSHFSTYSETYVVVRHL